MTEEECKIRRKMLKVQNLAERPGYPAEGQVAMDMIKKLKKKLKKLKTKDLKKQEEIIRKYRIKFEYWDYADMFMSLCNQFNLYCSIENTTKKGSSVIVEGTKSQVDVLVEINELIAPRFFKFKEEAYKPVSAVYEVYNKKIEAYKKQLLNADFSDAESIDPNISEILDSQFGTEDGGEEAFEGWE